MGMIFNRKLPIPKEIKEMYPLTERIAKIKEERDKEIRDIFEGRDKRFMLVIGPCSADKEEPVMDYTQRLARIQEEVKDKIFIIPRI
ncbi:MAG: 3-deoxy-7-phosphoheptulonate synthase, partial [Ruminiclostridium sp.]